MIKTICNGLAAVCIGIGFACIFAGPILATPLFIGSACLFGRCGK